MLFISEKVLSLQPNLLVSSSIYDIYVLGLTGFDGEMKWYVSTGFIPLQGRGTRRRSEDVVPNPKIKRRRLNRK